ncbi:MAG: ABC transporter ATP-binding protein [Peptostreptococcaceae bacterium]
MRNISYIKLNNISKKYKNNNNFSLRNFNLEIDKGEFIVILGPSGSGKSTLLQLICGFEPLDEGTIEIDNKDISSELPKDRDVSMVFQDYALFPHMTVYENISFGMKIRKNNKKIIEEKVKWASEALGLTEYIDKRPKELSGGQRQRVALARSMVREPKLFLMDEPLSNLDLQLRYHTCNEITALHESINATTIYVTHDHTEALSMASRIVIMNEGIIQQIGTPKEVYEQPNNLFVATFVGKNRMNIFKIHKDSNYIYIDDEKIALSTTLSNLENNKEYLLGIRPENIHISEGDSDVKIAAVVNKIEYVGGEYILHIKHKNNMFTIKDTKDINYKKGDKIELVLNLDKVNIFDINTKHNIKG